jgi:hypothetical protein
MVNKPVQQGSGKASLARFAPPRRTVRHCGGLRHARHAPRVAHSPRSRISRKTRTAIKKPARLPLRT